DLGPGRSLRLASKGQMDGIGTQARLRVRDAQGAALTDQKYATEEVPDVPAAMTAVGGWLRAHLGSLPVAVGHRVAHGGPRAADPARPPAPAVQPQPDPIDPGALPRHSAGGVLRLGLSPRPSRGGRSLCPARGALPGGRTTL